VAIGHEVDISLAELVADRRCSTPTHAAETLTPDKRDILNELKRTTLQLDNLVDDYNDYAMQFIDDSKNSLAEKISRIFDQEMKYIKESISLLSALNPIEILKRGYAIVRRNGKNINSKLIKTDDKLTIETYYNNIEVVVKSLRIKDNN
jgi:exodeoxyribonuclease VII large subunit